MPSTTITKLERVRDEIAEHDRTHGAARARLVKRRDALILDAIAEGVSERKVGAAAGMSGVAVHKKRPR